MSEMVFRVEGMVCEGCAAAVRRAVTTEDAAADVAVSLEAHEVRVSGAALPPEKIAAAISAAGYEVSR